MFDVGQQLRHEHIESSNKATQPQHGWDNGTGPHNIITTQYKDTIILLMVSGLSK